MHTTSDTYSSKLWLLANKHDLVVNALEAILEMWHL